ncbi:MAG: hypothetical protein ACE5IY_05255 [bacterium]
MRAKVSESNKVMSMKTGSRHARVVLFFVFICCLLVPSLRAETDSRDDSFKERFVRKVQGVVLQEVANKIDGYYASGVGKDDSHFRTYTDIVIELKVRRCEKDIYSEWLQEAASGKSYKLRERPGPRVRFQKPEPGDNWRNGQIKLYREKEKKAAIYFGELFLDVVSNDDSGLVFTSLSLRLDRYYVPKESDKQEEDSRDFKIKLDADGLVGFDETGPPAPPASSTDDMKVGQAYKKLEIQFIDAISRVVHSGTRDSIATQWSDSLDREFKGLVDETTFYDYYSPFSTSCLERAQAMFGNYLSQYDLQFPGRDIDRLNVLAELADSVRNKERIFKFSLLEYVGTQKTSDHPYEYYDPQVVTKQRRLELIPAEYRSHFQRSAQDSNLYFFKIQDILPKYYHQVAIRRGQVLNITLSQQNLLLKDTRRLADFFSHVSIESEPIRQDIISFIANYATSIMVGDKRGLRAAWSEDIAVRRFKTASELPDSSKGENITIALHNLSKKYDVWVMYEDRKDYVNYILSELREDGKPAWVRGEKASQVWQSPDFIFKTRLRQIWLDLNKVDRKLHYLDVAEVNFWINVFNIARARELLSSGAKPTPLFMFGTWLYLKHLFHDDVILQNTKSKWRNENACIDALLNVELPSIEDSAFVAELRKLADRCDESMMKEQLLAFFSSDDYDRLHLEYNPYHQTFIQILYTVTRQKELLQFQDAPEPSNVILDVDR